LYSVTLLTLVRGGRRGGGEKGGGREREALLRLRLEKVKQGKEKKRGGRVKLCSFSFQLIRFIQKVREGGEKEKKGKKKEGGQISAAFAVDEQEGKREKGKKGRGKRTGSQGVTLKFSLLLFYRGGGGREKKGKGFTDPISPFCWG